MNSRTRSTGWSLIAACCLVFLSVSLAGLQVAQSHEPLDDTIDTRLVSLRIQYYSGLAVYNVQKGQLKVMSGVSDGLTFAASKLCGNKTHTELDLLNKKIKKLQAAASADLEKGRELLNSIGQHLDASAGAQDSNQDYAKMKLDLAEMDLTECSTRSTSTGKQLEEIRKSVVKAEVVYQRALAECLLNDFKSLFGAGEAPAPVPDKEAWPDDLLDWEEDGGLTPDFSLFLGDSFDPDRNQ